MNTPVHTVVSLLAACVLAHSSVLVQSTFDSGDEGWRITTPGPEVRCENSSVYPCINPTLGPGYIIIPQDLGLMGFTAPTQYRGDMSAAFGGMLSYDMLRATVAPTHPRAGIVQITNGSTYTFPSGFTPILFLYWPVESSGYPGANWTHYDIPLTASAGWHVGTYFDQAFVTVPLYDRVATEADMRSFLGNIQTFWLLAEFQRSSGEIEYLDNVVVFSGPAEVVPEPSLGPLGADVLFTLCIAARYRLHHKRADTPVLPALRTGSPSRGMESV